MASFTYPPKDEIQKNQEKSEPISTSKESPLLGKIAEMQKTINELMDEHAKQGKRIDDLVGHHKAINDLVAKK